MTFSGSVGDVRIGRATVSRSAARAEAT